MGFARDNQPSGGHEMSQESAGVLRLFEDKAESELRLADSLAPGSDIVSSRGAVIAEVAVVKGLPGPAESTGGPAFSGEDGTKIDQALAALGHDPSTIFYMLSRPEPGIAPDARRHRLRAAVEAVDAELVVATDLEAGADLSAAFEVDRLVPGKVVTSCGRRLLVVSGFEDSLVHEERKREVWVELQAGVPRPQVF